MVKKGKFIIQYSYDPLGQRIKSVKTVEGKPSGTTLFLMSGMIEQARAKVASGGKQLASIDFHTLGLDLAGSLTATGGVGAVLATSKTQTSGYYTRTYLYDGNGNVISLCKTDTGTITANYTYSPFGKLIKSDGIDKQIADFTFSTKYADETELSYYGFRFYSAKLGRWLKRDPQIITQTPSIKYRNLLEVYTFLVNNGVNFVDVIGLMKKNITIPINGGMGIFGPIKVDIYGSCKSGINFNVSIDNSSRSITLPPFFFTVEISYSIRYLKNSNGKEKCPSDPCKTRQWYQVSFEVYETIKAGIFPFLKTLADRSVGSYNVKVDCPCE